MIFIKNYYDQQKELEIAYLRLKTLEENKILYFEETQPKSSKIKEIVVQKSYSNSGYDQYVIKTEELDKKISILKKEIKLLEKNLQYMEDNIRKMKSVEYQVFTYKYIDGIDVKKIASKLRYSEPHIYRILKIIKEIIKDDKK